MGVGRIVVLWLLEQKVYEEKLIVVLGKGVGFRGFCLVWVELRFLFSQYWVFRSVVCFRVLVTLLGMNVREVSGYSFEIFVFICFRYDQIVNYRVYICYLENIFKDIF